MSDRHLAFEREATGPGRGADPVEMGGGGILRPEVVKPLLGKNISVLAWGLGIDRLGMVKLGLGDIRDIFSNDLDFLRNKPVI